MHLPNQQKVGKTHTNRFVGIFDFFVSETRQEFSQWLVSVPGWFMGLSSKRSDDEKIYESMR